MKEKSLTHSFVVDRTPKQAFDAINNVWGWWSGEIEGETGKVDDVWTYRYKPFHMSQQKVTKLVPGKQVVWLVTDSYLSFVEDKTEWNGTKIIFDIKKRGGQTEVVFTHQGLTPADQCFKDCDNAWGSYIKGSLKNLIAKGKGQPNLKLKKPGAGKVEKKKK
ncbi:MAG TPA: SRPBCC domain-containing protein [bacterium]|nr:SRPBCC domain-containing protein [bacterium]